MNMGTEVDHVKINYWLLPLSWIYGWFVCIRNQMFKWGILTSRSFDVPIISVGNLTVGGTGKTPHVEYLIHLLQDRMKVAILSRGYKRETKGYILADENSTMPEIGDEPYQIKQKFKDIYVAVDKKRTHGIDLLTTDSATNDVDVILLDDAFQHRYVEPGINILLVNYHRLTVYDKLLPAGRLREPKQGKTRADIVIITKCPNNLRPLEYRMLIKMMNLYPYQSLYFTSMEYGKMTQLFGEKERNLEDINKDEQIMLLTGIASPKQMLADLQKYTDAPITHLSFGDHHQFKPKDIRRINDTFAGMSSPEMIITTEKDAARLLFVEGLSDEVREHLYILPIHVRFMLEQEEEFNNKIISYVRKNSRNSILVKAKNDHKSQNSHHLGNGVGPISFGNN